MDEVTAGTPWHLQVLGLPGYADPVAVRRAYAAALRQIDPETDPAGFGRLREAYEAARAWCEAGASEPTLAVSTDVGALRYDAREPEEVTAGASPDHPPVTDNTLALAMDFAAGVGTHGAGQVAALLAASLAEVRKQYIDAPGLYEEHLIDLVALQRIGHRVNVFAAAEEQFHWHEVGHLAALGERGQWVEKVLSERDAWNELGTDQRHGWLAVFARAETSLDTSLLRHWPEVARLRESYPAWLGLHLSHDTLQAWQSMFDAQSPSSQDMYRRMALPDSAFLPARVARARERARGRSSSWLAVLVMSMCVGIGHLVFNGFADKPSVPYDPTPLPADTPRQCADLYLELDAPDALAGRASVEAERLKTRADRCARAGHWHPPAPGR
ncbi:hypothetical protein SAMN05660880_00388 [Luteibacter sp. 22Crub2.1]|nr:hypothetical protein SAMN05660880_00388 [Luteibacter sp. 22Crub2.1]